jgi:hypothetical protein
LLTACSALTLAACGGDGEQERTAPPRIEAAVAQPLAERSENVARLLESGDRCAAAAEAAQLEQEVIAAINDRAIPDVYLEDLGSVAHELVAQIPPCEQPRDEDDEDKKDKKGKGKGKGHDKDKDD